MFLYKTLGDGPEVSGKIREWDSGEEDDPEWLGGEEDDTEWLGGEQGDNEKSKQEAPSATLTAPLFMKSYPAPEGGVLR